MRHDLSDQQRTAYSGSTPQLKYPKYGEKNGGDGAGQSDKSPSSSADSPERPFPDAGIGNPSGTSSDGAGATAGAGGADDAGGTSGDGGGGGGGGGGGQTPEQPCDCDPVDVPPQWRLVTFDSDMAVTIVTTADAIGESTLVDTVISSHVLSRGLMSFAVGNIGLSAAAASPTGGINYASVYADVVFGGADLVHVGSTTSSATGSCDGTDSSVDTLDFRYLAIDFNGFDFPGSLRSTQEDRVRPGSIPSIAPGNLAFYGVDVQAVGDNSFADVALEAITLEDQLSQTAVSATAAVDGTVSYRLHSGSSRAETIVTTAEDSIVEAGRGNDTIRADAGDDWLFGERGNDTVHAGAGDDTVFGGEGRDRMRGGSGSDWMFGGDDDDTMHGEDGDDLLYGGEDEDVITGGAGHDILVGGADDDRIDGGAGSDLFVFGGTDDRNDGDDVYDGGSGADLFLVTGAFGNDVIRGFSVAEGDRLMMPGGDWDSDAGLKALNGRSILLQRSIFDRDDLTISVADGGSVSTIVLDEFFAINQGFGSAPRSGRLGDDQALSILHAVFVDADTTPLATATTNLLQIGGILSDLG